SLRLLIDLRRDWPVRWSIALVSVSIAAVTGCGNAPVRQDIEFVRGCWVWKEPVTGRVLGFLRLLPSASDSNSFDGQVQIVDQTPPVLRSRFSFRRDGSAVALTSAGERVPSGTYVGASREDPPVDSQAALFRLPGKPGAVLEVE